MPCSYCALVETGCVAVDELVMHTRQYAVVLRQRTASSRRFYGIDTRSYP